MARHILFVSKSSDSASTRYRALQFFPQLIGSGFAPEHSAAAGSPLAYLQTLRRARAADIVVVLRKTFPAPYLWLLRRVTRRLVFDFDDAIFCNSDGSPSTTRMRRFVSMARQCDAMLAGNGFLATQAARFNARTAVVPTCIDTDRYVTHPAKPATSFDIVWIGSSATRKYLVSALPALNKAAQRIPGLRLKIIADFDLPEAALPTLAIPWSAETEAMELGSAHIGIAPMIDDDWTRGKCALKVLQYMAAGLPVVSSRAGANAEIIQDGVTGYLVDDDDGWIESLVRLEADADLRITMGQAGRRRATAEYALNPVWQRIQQILNALN